MADIVTEGNDVLTGGSGADYLYGAGGSDIINSGAGSDIIDGGSGSDRLNGGSGSDTLVYNLSDLSVQLLPSTDIYTGGAGKDTLVINLASTAEWVAYQTQIQDYLAKLAAVTNAKTGEVSNGSGSDFNFTFGSSTLTVQMIEKLEVWVGAGAGAVKIVDSTDKVALAPSAPNLDASSDSGAIADGKTNDETPTVIGGGAEPLATVRLYEGTTLLGTATADLSGDWSIDSSLLSNGTHLLTVTQVDLLGNTSAASAALAVTIDTIAPDAPVITSAADDSAAADGITNDATQVLTITAESGTTVSVYDGVTLLGTATETGTPGTYTFTTLALGEGGHSFTATATDTADNTSAASAALAVTIDTIAPSSLAIQTLDLLAASDSFGSGGTNTDNITNVTTPTIQVSTMNGVAMSAGDIIQIIDTSNGNAVVGSYTVVAGDLSGGTWSGTTKNITLSTTLSDGLHNLNVRLSDSAGNLGTQSTTTLGVTEDTTADAGADLAISAGTRSGNNQNYTISGLDTNTTATVTFSGTANPSGSLVITATQTTNGTFTQSISNFKPGTTVTVTIAADDVAGNHASSTSSFSVVRPAGVAGEPINLALADPSEVPSDQITVKVDGVPSGWTLNAGTNNGDGTWTIQTNDPSSLTVTTPADFAGAVVLGVNMSWTNADGSTGNAFISDNVEAYASGNPIFALSADDNLTGSSGADMFVFAQPIGNNVIHSFDAAADKIDLVGFTGVHSVADVSVANDANGNAMVSIGDGQTITIKGVDAAALGAANFLFDVDPVTTNTGTITISDGAIMPFGGSLVNSGTIELVSTGSETDLEILFRGVTLSGGGQVLLSDNAQNVIFGGSVDTVLTNADNTISGAGNLGGGQMTLVNAGLILADGANALVIDTGSNAVTNSGVMEATGVGGLIVDSALVNSGNLWANNGDIVVLGDASGAGSATISGVAMLEFGGASDQNVTFDSAAEGTLKLDLATAFTGSVSGYGAGDKLDLVDVAFGAGTQITYAANDAGTGGTLIVSDGTHTASLELTGAYAAAGMRADAAGGSELAYDAAAANHTMLGGLANDILVGGAGDDLFLGGLGNDTLTGGAGSDTFKFGGGDVGAVDTITDFDAAANSDVLNLRDLLVGEHSDAESLDSYLHFTYDAGTNTTVIDVMSQGSGVVDHQIQLEAFNATLFGSTDSAIITDLLAKGKLTVDA